MSSVAGLTKLVSARVQVGDSNAQGWVRWLDWNSGVRVQNLDLRSFDLQGAEDLLRKAGASVDGLVSRPEVIKGLHYLTDGEPLTLKFYVNDLQENGGDARRLEISGLDKIKRGPRRIF